MSYKYIRDYYGVPAETGREVSYKGEKGVIVEAIGQYCGVNLYKDKNTDIRPYHPNELEYLGMGKIRPLTRSQQNYRDYIQADCPLKFREWIQYKEHERKNPHQ